jgi:hypothetical protein
MSTRYLLLAVPLLLIDCSEPNAEEPRARPTSSELEVWLVNSSDDYIEHRDIFIQTIGDLVESGTCAEADRNERIGWMRSTVNFPDAPVYFTYCGGLANEHRIYLDVQTGQVFTRPSEWEGRR